MASTEPIITYQLAIPGGSDVVLRRLPSDASIAGAVERVKHVLDLVEDRVGVKVGATGQSPERKLTDDEATELEAALEQALGHKVTVHPYEAG
jgi:hypothetical protein